MGVTGLWDVIRPASQQRSIVHLAVHDGFLSTKHGKRGYRIGIDASIWFFHAHSSREGENPELRMLFFRLARFLALPLLPLFVFDGPKRPKYKRNKKVMGAQHPLLPSFREMIKAFGFEYHQAPGEAEAELAYLNRLEIIDVILSDDVDNFLFGANLVMRNPSATLSGNRAHAIRNADGRDDGKHVVLFSAEKIRQHEAVGLTHGGFILIGLLSGGDYDTRGLANFGLKTAHALARAGLGDSLVRIFEYVSPEDMQDNRLPMAVQHALTEWRTEFRHYLSTDPDKLIGRKLKALANTFPEWFPPLEVLSAYVHPVTSESRGHVPEFHWPLQPSLKSLANCCELHYEWGVRPLIIKRFRTVIWPGAFMRVLRAAVMQGDEKEANMTRRSGVTFTPTSGRRTVDMAVGTPSRLISRILSRMEIHSQRDDVDPFSDDYVPPTVDEPLAVKIHSERKHASTDHMLEYRLEIAPAQFVRITEEGLLHLRREDSIDVANFGRRQMLLPDEFGDLYEEEKEDDKKSKSEPNDHMRLWVPACMLEMVHPALVEEYEEKINAKLRREQEKIQRAIDRAEGRASPKKARAKGGGGGAKKGKGRNVDDKHSGEEFTEAIADSPTKRKGKITNSGRLVQGDSSDEDHDPTPKPKSRTKKAPPPTTKPMPSSLLDVLNSTIPEIIGSQSKASTRSSQPSKRRDQAQSLTKSSVSNGKPDTSKTIDTATARRFLFSMKPDALSEEEDALEEIDPYMALRETIGLGSSRPLSRLQDATEQPTPGPAGSSKSRTASQPVAGGRGGRSLRDDEPMEDFSHLFADDVTPLEASPSVNSSQSSQSSQSMVAKRTNRFVHSDTDEDEGLVTRKAPKRSTKQVSPPGRTEMRDARTNPRIPDTRSGLSSASEKATSNRPKLASQPNATSSQQRLSATEVIDLSDSEDDIEMISALQTSRPQPASQATKRAKVTKVSKSAADVSIIDLD